MKKSIIIGSLILAALLLSGCGKKPSNQNNPDQLAIEDTETPIAQQPIYCYNTKMGTKLYNGIPNKFCLCEGEEIHSANCPIGAACDSSTVYCKGNIIGFKFGETDSPFGAHGNISDKKTVSQMGINWIRLGGQRGLVFGEPQDEFEKSLEEAVKNNLHPIVTVKTGVRKKIGCFQKYPKDIEEYKEFLKTAVTKYKDKIQYFQFENEPAGENFWCDTAENYAKLLKEAYATVKEACPECKVVIAGATSSKFSNGNVKFYDQVFSELKKYPKCAENGCHDIFDLHLASCDICLCPEARVKCEVKNCSFNFMKNSYIAATDLQKKYDYIKPIWSTEFGALHSNLKNTQISLIKSFVYALDLGFEKLFWRVAEDCCKILDENNGQPTGTYFAYTTLISQINGYSSLLKLADGQYKFLFLDKKPVYVLWRESDNVAINSEIKDTVRVIDYSGKETSMDTNEINLTENPIFVIME